MKEGVPQQEVPISLHETAPDQNYFTHLRDQAVEQGKKQETNSSLHDFNIAKDARAIDLPDGRMFVIPRHKGGIVELEKRMADFYDKRAKLYHVSEVDLNRKSKELDEQSKQLLQDTFRDDELAIEDLAIIRRDKTPEEHARNEEDMRDYRVLMSKSMRETIQNEFNFKLPDLSLKEQFYFLQFLKHNKSTESESIKKFIREFKISGIKTLVSLDYDPEIGVKIIELAKDSNRAEVRRIFYEFGDIVSRAEWFTDKLKQFLSLQSSHISEDVRGDFSGYLYEAIVRRSKDLLVAAQEIVTQEEKGESDLILHDVTIALRGIKTFLTIANLRPSFWKSEVLPNTDTSVLNDMREQKPTLSTASLFFEKGWAERVH